MTLLMVPEGVRKSRLIREPSGPRTAREHCPLRSASHARLPQKQSLLRLVVVIETSVCVSHASRNASIAATPHPWILCCISVTSCRDLSVRKAQGEPEKGRRKGNEAEGAEMEEEREEVKGLSLIHISEPTRPRLI
eukprot:2053067-Rhodomonas_salina.1